MTCTCNTCRRYAEHKTISTSFWSSLLGSARNVVFILEFRVQPTTFDEGSHTVGESCREEIYTDEFSPTDDSWEWFTVRPCLCARSFGAMHYQVCRLPTLCPGSFWRYAAHWRSRAS